MYTCRCGDRYVGKTTQRLGNRIKQHLPAKAERSTKSAISEHLIRNADCLGAFDKSSFSIVKKARTESVLHVLEALYIKGLRPELCKQMEFVKCLHLV